jgi:fused signal recognition particle receptor
MTLRDSLSRTRQAAFGRVASLLGASELDDAVWEDLEALLIQADLGLETTLALTGALRERVQREGLTGRDQLQSALREELLALLVTPTPGELESTSRPLSVLMVVGANGSGKTTTIAKLAYRYQQAGRQVMLAAGDTFRAAAIEQLQRWAERVDVPVIAGQPGGDSGAVLYDAIRAARARGSDLLIADTAGRLHTNANLMAELAKVRRVAAKSIHQAPHETWLVLDGTTGQNALTQAAHFQEAAGVTGVVLTKLDSTAKGGMVFAVGHQLGLPVRFLGVGEGLDDLVPFDAGAFVDGLLTE